MKPQKGQKISSSDLLMFSPWEPASSNIYLGEGISSIHALLRYFTSN